MDKEPEPTVEPKKEEANPLLDILEENIEVTKESVEVQIVIPFD